MARKCKAKRVVSQLLEYPGATVWKVYEILCPICNKWSGEYGDVDTMIDGEWIAICNECGKDKEGESCHESP